MYILSSRPMDNGVPIKRGVHINLRDAWYRYRTVYYNYSLLSSQEYDSRKKEQLSKEDFCQMYEGIIQDKKVCFANKHTKVSAVILRSCDSSIVL